jgi:glycosyltransferase involved in cell wall biosynthesis
MAQATPPIAELRVASTVTPHVRPAAVWLLTNAPSPYQAELFTAIAERPDVELSVRLMRSASSAGRAVASGFGGVVMSAVAPASWRDEFRLHPRALWEAAFGRYDCYILSGLYTSITFICCAAILQLRRKPWVIWLERPRRLATAVSPRQSSPLARLRDVVRTRLVCSATRVLCIGSAARREYAALGATEDRLDVLPYCCDLARYDDVAPKHIAEFREEHGLQNSVVFLFSGQLIARKGVDTLLRAFEQVAASASNTALVILGDGPLRGELEAQVSPECRDRVHFLGHLPQQDLPTAFRAADVFVFPSRHDGWGVVINEACAARLPIIASEETGAAGDLVVPGGNGFRHAASDVDAFYHSMKRLTQNAKLRQEMAQRSGELVQDLSPKKGAARFAESVRKAIAKDLLETYRDDYPVQKCERGQ